MWRPSTKPSSTPRSNVSWHWAPSRIDIGQGDVDWVVMADPDGNEFCVLRHA